MHEYTVGPEVVRVALVVGVVVSMLFYERVQLTTGGAIVPAYLALSVRQPLAIATTLTAAYATYVAVSVVVARRLILYGRRKFEVEVLVGLGLVLVTTVAAGRLGHLDPVLLELSAIGFLVPGILAHDMARQRPGRTAVAVLATTAIMAAFIFVFASLLAISQLPQEDDLPSLPSVTGYPRGLLLVAAAISVGVGMLVFARLGLRSGGFITGAYLALIGPRWFDLVFALVVALATWFVVVRLLMPRLLLFGRRKLSTMVLVAALLGWAAELGLAAVTHGDYVPWRGLTVIPLMVPALLANDAQRQGWLKTLWGSGLNATGTYAGVNLIAALLGVAGVAVAA